MAVPTIDGATSLNAAIATFNDINSQWQEFYGPVSSARETCLKACGLDDCKGADISHVLLGLCLSMVADSNMTKEQLLESIKFINESPFLSFGAAEKW